MGPVANEAPREKSTRRLILVLMRLARAIFRHHVDSQPASQPPELLVRSKRQACVQRVKRKLTKPTGTEVVRYLRYGLLVFQEDGAQMVEGIVALQREHRLRQPRCKRGSVSL